MVVEADEDAKEPFERVAIPVLSVQPVLRLEEVLHVAEDGGEDGETEKEDDDHDDALLGVPRVVVTEPDRRKSRKRKVRHLDAVFA